MSASPQCLENCPIPTMQFGADGRVRAVNPAWKHLAGEPSSDWLEIVHPDDRERARRLALSGGEIEELRIRILDGSWHWILANSVTLPEGIVLYALDIHAKRDEREDISKALVRERELNELKTRFISVVSHEFRTPLTVILSSAELLEHYGSNWNDQKRGNHLRKIHGAVTTMSALLDNVALHGRAESGRLENRPEPTDLSAFCGEILQEAYALAQAAQEVLFDDQANHAMVQVDPRLLRHILVNLLSNAIKFSPQGGTVRISARLEPGGIAVVVKDQGIGIPAQDMDHVFERFHRSRNAEGIPGTGLGLAIVRRCVEICEGSITCESEEGKGTVFEVRLPSKEGNV